MKPLEWLKHEEWALAFRWVIPYQQYQLNISSLWAWGQRVGKTSSPLLRSVKPDSFWEKCQYFQLRPSAARIENCNLLRKQSCLWLTEHKGCFNILENQDLTCFNKCRVPAHCLGLLGPPLRNHKSWLKVVEAGIYAVSTNTSVTDWFSEIASNHNNTSPEYWTRIFKDHRQFILNSRISYHFWKMKS